MPARQEAFPLKGCGALDWGMQSRLARIFRPDTRRTVMLAIDHGYFQGPGNATEFFDATVLEVADEIEVADGRFSIAIVTAGDGWAEGDFGRQPVRKGQTFAWPASLSLRLCAGRAAGPGDPVPGRGRPRVTR